MSILCTRYHTCSSYLKVSRHLPVMYIYWLNQTGLSELSSDSSMLFIKISVHSFIQHYSCINEIYRKHIQQSIFLAAVLPETTHHVTTKHVTTTPRPTPERYEQTNNFYLYDRDSVCISLQYYLCTWIASDNILNLF